MSGQTHQTWRNELQGALVGAVHGIPLLAMPCLVFVGILGPHALEPSLWGTLLAITLVPVVRLLLGGAHMLMLSPRTASIATYVALVLHMGMSASGGTVSGSSALLTLPQLSVGLAVASLMYLIASMLVAFSGLIKLGRVFKMIPSPVTSGISNGTALLLLLLAFNKASEDGLPAALVCAAMVLASYGWGWLKKRRIAYASVIPSILVAVVIGYAGTALLGYSQDYAAAAGVDGIFTTHWLSFELWRSLDEVQLSSLLMLAIPGTITLALVMVLETFTVSSIMEIRFGARSNADRELIAMGCANMLGAVLGGVPSTATPIFSVATWQAGGRRQAAWIICGMCGLIMLFFAPWLIALPAGIATGFLVLQATVLVSPVFIQSLQQVVRMQRWKKPSHQDLGFWITLIISLVGFFGNLVWACFAGVGLSCLVVLRRVSANLTARWLYLDAMRSRRIRSAAESDALGHLAHQVGILQLSGHLFFGNSGRITQLADELDEGSQCVVVDFSQVLDVDPSGADAVSRLLSMLVERQLQVVVSGLRPARVSNLNPALNELTELVHCVDLDRGLEYCEEWVLQHGTQLPRAQEACPIHANSLLQGLTEDEITAVLLVVDVRKVAQGEALFRRDERSDGVWMLQSGRVSILVNSGTEASRLATFGPGQFVGEMGFIDGNNRSATVTADTAVEAVLLDSNAVAGLVRDHPHAALKITRNIARELSQRVRTTSAMLSRKADANASSWENSALSVFKN